MSEFTSEAFAQRKEAILGDLLALLETAHRRRRTRRRAAFVSVVFLASAGLAFLAIARSTAPVRSDSIALEQDATEAHAHRSIDVRFVSTDRSIVDRHAFRPTETRVEIVGDTELLDALAALDCSAGLVRTGGRAWLSGDVIARGQEGG